MAKNLTFLLRASILSTLVVSLAAFDLPLPSANVLTTPDFFQVRNMGNIIEALLHGHGSRDSFAIWGALLLGHTTGPVLPPYATLFVPSYPAVAHLSNVKPAEIDPFLIPYHITPQRLSFDDLLSLDLETRLPTLLPSKSIIITSNSSSNFAIDDSQITHPNIYLSPNFAVHGIKSIFNYSLYGEAITTLPQPFLGFGAAVHAGIDV
ncbi:Fasciclin-like arabinogalactan family protein [Heracleum sosnowskyi]|uniref:Fasciclin-like arabinogalactan family protein n=1 Tax=Heracleum sosnowskyi TaxID=360622 RepID=A0AAD8J1W2_9APIA|nr:Fasciclin-like arabinogalactan family protein [Heracleum sosnowskyi]